MMKLPRRELNRALIAGELKQYFVVNLHFGAGSSPRAALDIFFVSN
jgi:hypothetical protein